MVPSKMVPDTIPPLEATWAALSYNLIRWFALRRQPALTDAVVALA